MSTISNSKHTLPIVNSVTIPPLTAGQVYATNMTGLGGGSSGQVYTTNGTAGQFLTTGINGTSWSNITSNNVMVVSNNPAELEVKGRVVINGRDLEERLNTIEKVLCIPERDVILEKKHPKLKKLFDEYINALEKYKTFERIKGTYD